MRRPADRRHELGVVERAGLRVGGTAGVAGRQSVGDVEGDGALHQHRLLRDDADLTPQVGQKQGVRLVSV